MTNDARWSLPSIWTKERIVALACGGAFLACWLSTGIGLSLYPTLGLVLAIACIWFHEEIAQFLSFMPAQFLPGALIRALGCLLLLSATLVALVAAVKKAGG